MSVERPRASRRFSKEAGARPRAEPVGAVLSSRKARQGWPARDLTLAQTTAALLQPASFRAAARVLRTGGALAVNVIGTLDGYGPVPRVTRHLTRHFDRVRVVPVMEADEAYASSAARNVVLVASRRAR